MITQSFFLLWLKSTVSESHDQRYRHQLVVENADEYPQGIQNLISYVHRAHEDARNHLYKLASISLDPLGASPVVDLAQGYPEQLEELTLKGYLGEIFAALVIEYYDPFGESDWEVPAMLFRFHSAAFDQLEEMRAGKPAKRIPGRLGNDCLAFQFDEQGKVRRVLCAEAKCIGTHDSTKLVKAHMQIGEVGLLSLGQIIEILLDRNDPIALTRVDGIRQLWLTDPSDRCERCDLVSYVCGQSPIRTSTWLPVDHPHDAYQGGRRFEAIEIHLDDVESVLQQVYCKQDRRTIS